MSATIKFAAAAVLVAVTAFLFHTPPSVEAATLSGPAVFDIGAPEEYLQGDAGPTMLGFLVSVEGDGRPASIDRAFRLRGTPPPFRTTKDVSRVYRWELRDDDGRVLESGQYLDRLALYGQQGIDEGCVKTVVSHAHTIVVRTPDHPAAARLALEVESYHGDVVEEGR